MTDTSELVERLRLGLDYFGSINDVMNEAADAIERLAGTIGLAEATCNSLDASLVEAQATIVRLEEEVASQLEENKSLDQELHEAHARIAVLEYKGQDKP